MILLGKPADLSVRQITNIVETYDDIIYCEEYSLYKLLLKQNIKTDMCYLNKIKGVFVESTNSVLSNIPVILPRNYKLDKSNIIWFNYEIYEIDDGEEMW